MVHATDNAGIELRTAFEAECANLGIAVVASVAIPTGLDWESNAGKIAAIDIASTLSLEFTRENVRTYYLAIPQIGDARLALSAANISGTIGPGYHVLIPSFILAARSSLTSAGIDALLHGAVGVFPSANTTSPSANRMWEAWPKDAEAWTSLLETTPLVLETRATPQPSVVRARISLFTHYTWDATFFAAKAIATTGCVSGLSSTLAREPPPTLSLWTLTSPPLHGVTASLVGQRDRRSVRSPTLRRQSQL